MERTTTTTLLAAALLLGSAAAQDPALQEQRFPTPEQAAEALIKACESNDLEALAALVGDKNKDLVEAIDDAGAEARRKEFAGLAREQHELKKNANGSRTLLVGDDKWPFPIPIVKGATGWHWDGVAGREELLNRIVGENEYRAISICRGYVDAQMEYAGVDRDGDDVLEYAQLIRSTPGKRDGLYWQVDGKSDELLSPLGPLVRELGLKPDASGKSAPKWGYYFKILKKQGGNVPGGAYDYVINGHMIAGFALVAVPVKHGLTGVTTFLVNHRGRVYEKDLGGNSLELVKAMDTYDPDESWTLVEEEEE